MFQSPESSPGLVTKPEGDKTPEQVVSLATVFLLGGGVGGGGGVRDIHKRAGVAGGGGGGGGGERCVTSTKRLRGRLQNK